jgi:putative alpha-1,2-mannosidase
MDISPDSERDEQNGNYLEVFPNDNTETSSTNKAANLSDAVFEESQENLTIKVATKLSSAIKAAQNVPIEEQNSMDTTEEKKSEIGKSNNSWINRIEQNAVNPNEKGQRS